jgi:ribonuclease-3
LKAKLAQRFQRDPNKLAIRRFVRSHFGVRLRNIDNYLEALRHSSSVIVQQGGKSNERLEFLGDAVLDMVVVDDLYQRFPDSDEGDLTRMKSRVVNRTSLNDLGRSIGIVKMMDLETGRNEVHDSIYGNAFESLVGAVYLDLGYRKTMVAVHRLFKKHDVEGRVHETVDFKSQLHEWCQQHHKKIQFEVLRSFRTKGINQYEIQVLINGKVRGKAIGSSKKSAEQGAARKACGHIFGPQN